jgi:hypothetical protein
LCLPRPIISPPTGVKTDFLRILNPACIFLIKEAPNYYEELLRVKGAITPAKEQGKHMHPGIKRATFKILPE